MAHKNANYGVNQFAFEDGDIHDNIAWFCDFGHCTPPMSPLHLCHGWLWPGYRGIQQAYAKLYIPTGTGWEVRARHGRAYPTVILTTEEEAKERAPIFAEKIKPFIEDFDAIWTRDKEALLESYMDLKKKYGIVHYNDIKKLRNVDLLEIFDDFRLITYYKMWEVHMHYFIPMYYLFGLFQKLCLDLTGIKSTDPLFSKAMAGFDSKAYQFNTKIFNLGNLAMKLGLEDIFSLEADKVMPALRSSGEGQEWLAEYDKFLSDFGWRCERINDWCTPTWIERPELGIPLIRLSITGKGSSNIDELLTKAKAERLEAERELLDKVPEDHKEWFKALMGVSQNAGLWSEDHTFYCELYGNALGRWITKEIGDRFEANGVLDSAEDIYFLMPDEILKALIPMGRVKLHDYAAERKAEYEGYLRAEPEPLLGNPAYMGQIAMKDTAISVASSYPIVNEELKADLYGSASTHGMVEGIARVIMSERELDQLIPGEILVAPATSALWTPAFELISGIVTNDGGALSHALIVAREYGVPAVTGTQAATGKIATGDKIRVDGDLGVVYILGKKG